MIYGLPSAFFEVAGFVGVALYLGSYAALQAGKIRGSGYTYAALNLAAASFVLLSLAATFNLWSAIIQISWIVISVVGITRFYLLTRRTRFSDEERGFLDHWFPDLSAPDARKFLDAGNWVDAAPGREMAVEGTEIGFLYFLSQGRADVTAGGKPVGQLAAPSVVGELTCFDGGLASATVRSAANARYFTIETGALARVCEQNPALRLQLQASLAKDTRAKLTAANLKLSTASEGAA